MKRRFLWFRLIPAILLVWLAAVTGMLWFWNRTAFFICLAVWVVLALLVVVYQLLARRTMYQTLRRLSAMLPASQREVLQSFPIPVAVLGGQNEILWYNTLFRRLVIRASDAIALPITRFLPDFSLCDRPGVPQQVAVGESRYFLYTEQIADKQDRMTLVYFIENTELVLTSQEYAASRPSVGLIVVDNMDELVQVARESERAHLSAQIEKILEQWIASTSGFLRRIGNDRFLFIVEERHMAEIIRSRFAVLDEVRRVSVSDRMTATLSIGVGRGGETLRRCEETARQALDMALGRGGDQAAVKYNNEFTFYGGVSQGVEKSTRVRSRVIASALSELIENSENVLVMGHAAADLDCLGAAVGIVRIAQTCLKPVHIVINRESSLSGQLERRIEANGMGHLLLSPANAQELLTRRTLLIIVDTHRKDFVDAPEIYRQCRTVVVIDHHRKMADFIDNAVIFFHEPAASSTCEMVTELLQYMDQAELTRFEAQALLSGIMLDTKNFILRAGVRTFEAAAFLRRKGADTVEVKKLFAGSIEQYQCKAGLVSAARIHRRCAISCAESSGEQMRICAAQAADELLSIEGVDASFVLFSEQDTVFFSARSMGAVNVQVIMESLGGGGHLMMAGAQMRGVSMNEARDRLLAAIDRYLLKERPNRLPGEADKTQRTQVRAEQTEERRGRP